MIIKMKKTFNCIECGIEHIFRKHQSRNKYCSTDCQREYQYKARIADWKLSGTISRISGTPGYIRRYLFEKQNGCCNHCKNTEWLGKPINLELEHKDGNSENDHEDNIELICPNCHSYTPTYKGANRGNGRHSRRERYKEGKSF